MPFTVSHALYALPLRYIRSSYLSATGLILGSMSPDMEYFIRLEPYRSIGHSWQGLWLQALPLCMVLGLVFHKLVKVSLAAHLPSAGQLNSRCLALFQAEQLSGFKAWSGFVLSVVIGFASHILLDQFTHAHSMFTPYVPWLWHVELFTLPLYKLMQYSLSLIGLLGLMVWLGFSLYRINPLHDPVLQRTTHEKRLYWLIVVIASFIATIAKLVVSSSGNTIGIIVVAPITGALLGVIIASLFVQWKKI